MYIYIYVYTYIYMICICALTTQTYQWSDPNQPPCLADPSEGPPPAKLGTGFTFWTSKVVGKSSITLWKLTVY